MSRRPAGRAGVLTLTTDFGARDHYVGAMKGVIAALAPQVRVFDISHDIPSFDVAEGAFAIAQAYRYYPEGTVHVVVVDPGVGSSRRPVAVAVSGHWFVAPDNGVLSQVIEAGGPFEARRIDERHGLAAVSRTFHGRDLFAPVGAQLASELPFDTTGPLISDLVLMPPVAVANGSGRVLHVDRFGNIVTSFRASDLPDETCLAVGNRIVCERAQSYGSVRANRLFLILGSSGYVEISLNQGSAAKATNARAGDRVRVVGASPERGGDSSQSASEVL